MSKPRRHPRRRDRTRTEGRPLNWPERLRRALPGVLITIFLIFLFSHVGTLHRLQTVVTDARMRMREPPEKSEVVVVKITEEDYRELFYGASPLDPAALWRLVDAVALGRPKVIGVDIDTSAPQFRNFQLPANWAPVIWERDVKEVPESVEEKPEPLEVLGGKDHSLTARFSGLTLLIDDAEDKVTRRYRRVIETTEGPVNSFVWAVAAEAMYGGPRSPTAPYRDRFIRYYDDSAGGAGFRLTASQVMAITKDHVLPDDNPFRGKIVLIGGAYAGQDVHDTPLGRRNGVDILAQAVETEMGGAGDPAPGRAITILLEIFEGVLTVFLFHFFIKYGFLKALLYNMVVVVVLALLCSVVASQNTWGVSYFLPLLLCVLAFEFIFEYRIHLVDQVGKILSGEREDH